MAYFRSMASTRHPAKTCSALSEAMRSRTRVGYYRSTPSLISVESLAPTPSALLASTSLRTHGRPRLHPEESSRRLQSGLHHPLLHLRRCGHIRPPSPLSRLLLRRAWRLRSFESLRFQNHCRLLRSLRSSKKLTLSKPLQAAPQPEKF